MPMGTDLTSCSYLRLNKPFERSASFRFWIGVGITVGRIDWDPQVRPVQGGKVIGVLVHLADLDHAVLVFLIFKSLGRNPVLEELLTWLEIINHFPLHCPRIGDCQDQEPDGTTKPHGQNVQSKLHHLFGKWVIRFTPTPLPYSLRAKFHKKESCVKLLSGFE